MNGSILKHLEDCGHAHLDDECFVFDARRGVNAALQARVNIGASSDSHARQAVESLPD